MPKTRKVAKAPKYTMPARLPEDGALHITRLDDNYLNISVEGGGSLTVSFFNAWRMFGFMSLFLELPLSKEVSQSIKDESPTEMTFNRGNREKMSFGDRFAAALADEYLKEELTKNGLEMIPVVRGKKDDSE